MAEFNLDIIDSFLKEVLANPDMRKKAEIIAKKGRPEYIDLLNKVKAGSSIAQSLIGMGEGISQKNLAKKELDKLVAPTIPGYHKVGDDLKNIMNKVRAIGDSPERNGALSAYQQQMKQAYQTGLEQARTASGGQSGAFGSQAQALYNQRLNQAQQLPAMISQTQLSAYGTAGQLAAEAEKLRSYEYMNNLNRYKLAADDYRSRADAAAGLYGAGARNFYNSMNYGMNAVQNPLADMLYELKNKTGIDPMDQQREHVNQTWGKIFRSNMPYQSPSQMFLNREDFSKGTYPTGVANAVTQVPNVNLAPPFTQSFQPAPLGGYVDPLYKAFSR